MSYLEAEWDDGSKFARATDKKTDSYCNEITIPSTKTPIGWTPYRGISGYISGFLLRFDDDSEWDSKKVDQVEGNLVESSRDPYEPF